MQKKFFGTDGIRGRFNGPVINAAMMETLGWSIGTVLQKETVQPTVIIGRDTRASGEVLQHALVSGLAASGVLVMLLGVLPTPAIAYFTKQLKAQAGIIISASHNPHQDNGIKCIGADGMKLADEWELLVETQMKNVPPISSSQVVSQAKHLPDVSHHYLQHCQQLIGFLDLSDIKIVCDCANGAVSSIAPQLFVLFSAVLIPIHYQPDGTNINAHCGATDLASLQQRVLSEKACCGIAFDGDGDRLIMVDHQGEIVDGDELLGILAMHQKQCTGVVGTLMTNLGLEKALQARGIPFVRTAVGDRYVLERLKEMNWRLGGEASGHIINLDYSATGDGMLTALQILQIMQKTQQSLHELKQVVQKRPQILINVPVRNPQQYLLLPQLQEAIAQAEKSLSNHGRVLLRASGTESCVRVMVEGDDAQHSQFIATSLAKLVETVGESA